MRVRTASTLMTTTAADILAFLHWAKLLSPEALHQIQLRSPEFFSLLFRLVELGGQVLAVAGPDTIIHLAGDAKSIRQANVNFMDALLRLDASGVTGCTRPDCTPAAARASAECQPTIPRAAGFSPN